MRSTPKRKDTCTPMQAHFLLPRLRVRDDGKDLPRTIKKRPSQAERSVALSDNGKVSAAASGKRVLTDEEIRLARQLHFVDRLAPYEIIERLGLPRTKVHRDWMERVLSHQTRASAGGLSEYHPQARSP